MSRQTIINVCQKEKIDVKILSRGWLLRLEKNGHVRHVFKNCLPLNSQSASAIAGDKFATFEVLRAAQIPVIDHAILYPFDCQFDFAAGCNTPAYLEQYFNDHRQNIVLKPNHGFGGQGITHIESAAQFPAALTAAFAHSDSASLCPFYDIRREYRVIMLDGEARLVYAKKRGADWRFNLQKGATALPVEDAELRARLVELARRAAQELDLRFCSVDIIEPFPETLDPSHEAPKSPAPPHKISKALKTKSPTSPAAHQPTKSPDFLVIEVNSTVGSLHYCEQHPSEAPLVENIFRDAILKMFDLC